MHHTFLGAGAGRAISHPPARDPGLAGLCVVEVWGGFWCTWGMVAGVSKSLDVQTVLIDSLRPHPQNPRLGNVDGLVESLRVHGQYKPIVISSDGVVIAGNHTYYAAMELGFKQMSAVRLDFPHDDPRAVKIMLVDNRSSDMSRYDNSELVSLLTYLEDDLIGTGYDGETLDDLMALLDEQSTTPLVINDPHVTTLPNLQEKMEKYQAMGRRMIVLDYSQEEYGRVTQQFERLRERYKVVSNAEAVQLFLNETVSV